MRQIDVHSIVLVFDNHCYLKEKAMVLTSQRENLNDSK